jgi:hypothetical protein
MEVLACLHCMEAQKTAGYAPRAKKTQRVLAFPRMAGFERLRGMEAQEEAGYADWAKMPDSVFAFSRLEVLGQCCCLEAEETSDNWH